MSQKYRHVGFSNLEIKTEKKLRFDEENIRTTLYPIDKDYGLKIFSGFKTPFPTHGDPVAAEILSKRLQEYIDRDNGFMCNDKNNNGDDEYYKVDETQTPDNSWDSENEEKRKSEFIKKRKIFSQAEFIIAQQKSMSLVMPEPGPSIDSNWPTVDNDSSLIAANLTDQYQL